jgi:hypothetical protein
MVGHREERRSDRFCPFFVMSNTTRGVRGSGVNVVRGGLFRRDARGREPFVGKGYPLMNATSVPMCGALLEPSSSRTLGRLTHTRPSDVDARMLHSTASRTPIDHTIRLGREAGSAEDTSMSSLAVDGFYTLCLRDVMRPDNGAAPQLARAASDLVAFAHSRGIDQHTLVAELDRASRSVEWVTSFEIQVHTQALALGRAAIQQAYGSSPGSFDVRSAGRSPERSRQL